MKKLLTIYIGGSLLLFLSLSCASSTPQSLGEEICNCYKKLDAINNEIGKIEQVNRCGNLQTINRRALQRLGVNNDWTYSEVSEAEQIFDNAIQNCR